MAELVKKELKEGKKQLEGVLILCWILAIITGIGILSGFGRGHLGILSNYLYNPFSLHAATGVIRNLISFPLKMVYSLIVPALYVVELVGIYQRKAFAVPLGRAVLVVTMVFFFPVGTIIGAILWKRFNHPLSKRYLNYED
ncbi:MAG: hypothetical protein HQ569_05465 [Actinobacteria bacterium]|nr:hypothetical protein [Actinomycetota bacterium]